MAEFTDWASLDTTLPAATSCEVTVKTSDGEKTIDELGGLPDNQEWTETERDITSILISGPYDEYSIMWFRPDRLLFELDTDSSKTMQLSFTYSYT